MKSDDFSFFTQLFKRKTIRRWVTLPSLLQLLVTIGLIGFFLIQAGINSSHLILKELQQHTLHQIHEQIEQRLNAAMTLNQINYDSLQSGILNLDSTVERERYFSNHIKAFPDIAMTFIGLADGSFYGARRTTEGEIQVVRNNSSTGGESRYYHTSALGEGTSLAGAFPNYDARTRPWYIKASEAGKPTYTNIYSHFIFHEPTVTASYPVYGPEHRLIGVFGVDYILSWMGEALGSLPIGASGQIFVTDGKGLLIATSLDKQPYKLVDGISQLINAQESDSEIIKAAVALPAEEFQKVLPGFAVGDKKYYVGRSYFQDYGINWTIHVVLAESDFLGGVREATSQMLMILIISLIFSLFFAFGFAIRITKPIVEINKAARELSKGNLIPIPDEGREDELGELGRSFNEMGLRITNLVSHLEEEVKARTLELQERNAELQQLSFSDSLTGIANRRQFDNTMKSAWNMALRRNRPIIILMLDIDYFKDFNDTYGHQAGDDCLKCVGSLLSSKVYRASDLVARYGGEEFIIILQDTRTDMIRDFAEGIRNGVLELDIKHITSPFKLVTVSIGAAHMIPTPDTTPATLIELADRALYHAKEKGRNNVVLSEN